VEDEPPFVPATDLKHSGIAQKTAGGVLWVGSAALLGRAAAFLSQVALGWLLFADDFRLYALTISLTVVVSALRDGGTHRILLQQGERFTEIARPVFRIALGFNVTAALLLAAIAPFAVSFYDEPSLTWLVMIVALSIPLGTPASLFRSSLSINGQFKELAGIDARSMLLRQGSMVALAYAGFGAFSFVLPYVIVPLYEWSAMRRIVGPLPSGRPLTLDFFRTMFRASRWVILATPAIGLLMQGDYLVVGKLAPELLGVYFFGFQLIGSVAAALSSGIMAVVMPMLARVVTDPARRGLAFLRAERVFVFGLAPVAVGGALIAGPLIEVLWQGKWNQSIPVAQIIAITLVPMMVGNLALSLLEAMGRWRLRTGLLLVHATSVLLAAYVGSTIGGISYLTAWVGGAHAVNGLLQGLIATRQAQVSYRSFLAAVTPPVLLSLFAGAATLAVSIGLFSVESAWQQILVHSALFALIVGTGILATLRHTLSDAMSLFAR
jgi:O-antigen/teichoic acid export membrane protein